jgi:CheY-like chemotaxis protein
LFDPFYSTKAVGAGTGLGLSVVQAVAAGHGGRVEVDETPGGGATFRMLIPKNSGFKKEPETSAVAVSQAGALVGLRVLIADDESTMCSVLDRACKKYGATTTVVGDAQAAIDLIEREDFDIYLLDVRMPGGGGPAVFRFLKERRKTVSRTIFISGELSSEMNEIVGGGYAGILKKPFKIAQLVSMLCLASGRDLKK